jgi:3-hydroxybutyryl-CoA dehydrogenase
MEILVIGSEINLQECRAKFGDQHLYRVAKIHSEAEQFFRLETIIFDFRMSETLNEIGIYQNFAGIVFFDLSKNSLEQLVNSTETKAAFFGFCGLHTFLNLEILEVSLSRKTDLEKLEEVCRKLNTKFAVVKAQVGLLTARVICMIINEAYFAIQENIASREDIDLAMKLGTNDPFGPFEWCEKIGVGNVYELLNAVYESTKDERYKVCELLEEEAGHFTQRRKAAKNP